MHCLIICINYAHTEWPDEWMAGRPTCVNCIALHWIALNCIRSTQGIVVQPIALLQSKSIHLIFIEVPAFTEWRDAWTAAGDLGMSASASASASTSASASASACASASV